MKEEKIHDFFKNLKLDKLTKDEASALVEPIREKEVKETIIKLKNNKTPGIDGLQEEYYKVFVRTSLQYYASYIIMY